MESNQDELKEHLMRLNEEFKRLIDISTASITRNWRLAGGRSRNLSNEEQAEEHRLKKVKLRLKD